MPTNYEFFFKDESYVLILFKRDVSQSCTRQKKERKGVYAQYRYSKVNLLLANKMIRRSIYEINLY